MSDRKEGAFDQFYDSGAGGYDQSFGRVSGHFIPALLRAAKLGPGQQVLDVATGTGIAAEAAAKMVGSSGHVTATDISRPMLDKARERLSGLANVSFAVENGQALTLLEASFDAVLCSVGLMFFPDPLAGLAEFRRVLRDGGRCAVSVATTPERSFVSRINAAIGRHVPSRAAASAQHFSLGDAGRLQALFEEAGFLEFETTTEYRRFPFTSFDAYFAPIEGGQGPTATEYRALPTDVRRAIREDVRRELEGTTNPGGPIEVPVEIRISSGRR